MRSVPALLAVLILLGTGGAEAAPLRVEVDADRITLGDVVPRAPPEAGRLDLGPAPAPGRSRRLSRRDLADRLHHAMVSSRGLRLRPVVVVRPAQRLTEQQLQARVRRATQAQLDERGTVNAVRLRGGVLLPRGEVAVTVRPLRAWRDGVQPVQIEVRAGPSAPRRLMASVEVSMPQKTRTVLVERGAEVTIVARLPGVRVRTTGVAQSPGALGERVVVLPAGGQRAVRARVVAARTVEVEP